MSQRLRISLSPLRSGSAITYLFASAATGRLSPANGALTIAAAAYGDLPPRRALRFSDRKRHGRGRTCRPRGRAGWLPGRRRPLHGQLRPRKILTLENPNRNRFI